MTDPADLTTAGRYLGARLRSREARARLAAVKEREYYDLPLLVRVEERIVEKTERAEAAALAALDADPAGYWDLGGVGVVRIGGES